MADRGWVVAIEGRSAAGKTTLVRAAAEELGWQALAEAYDRLDPAPSLEYSSPRELLELERTLLAEESRRYREARRESARGVTVLADTGFFGPITYTRGLVDLGRAPDSVWGAVERSARSLVRRGALGIPDLTFYLESTTTERLRHARADPDRHPKTLAPRHEVVGEVERSYFEDVFSAALPERFRVLNGRAGRRSLIPSLRTVLAELDPTVATRAEGLRLLSRLPSLPADDHRRSAVPNR